MSHPDPDHLRARKRAVDPDQADERKRARHHHHAEAAAAAAAADPDPVVPPADAEADEDDIPQPIRAGAVDWSKYMQDPDDPILDPSFCVECQHAKCKAISLEEGNQKWMAMEKLKESRFDMHPFSHVRERQRLYNEGVRHNLLDNDGVPLAEDPGPWPAQQIWEHDLYHVVNPTVLAYENARSVQTVLRAMADNIRTATRKNPERVFVDVKMAKEYIDAWKKAQPLFDKLPKRNA